MSVAKKNLSKTCVGYFKGGIMKGSIVYTFSCLGSERDDVQREAACYLGQGVTGRCVFVNTSNGDDAFDAMRSAFSEKAAENAKPKSSEGKTREHTFGENLFLIPDKEAASILKSEDVGDCKGTLIIPAINREPKGKKPAPVKIKVISKKTKKEPEPEPESESDDESSDEEDTKPEPNTKSKKTVTLKKTKKEPDSDSDSVVSDSSEDAPPAESDDESDTSSDDDSDTSSDDDDSSDDEAVQPPPKSKAKKPSPSKKAPVKKAKVTLKKGGKKSGK